MKTREERAREYATIISENPDPLRPGDAPRVAMRVDKHLAEAFIAGAEAEHAELTRWNDPKEPPKNSKMVLIRVTYKGKHTPSVGLYDANGWHGSDIHHFVEVTGWREIHE